MVPASAQEERPQIMPGERKPAKKKDSGPRAVGVLQLAANGKATLVPIAILINGKFWDASVYKGDPVPMALDPGVVYEAERTGSSQGLFTVASALHSNAANVQSPWIATGKWLPAGADEGTKEQKAESAPVGIDNADAGPPRLTKNPNAVKNAPSAGSTTPASTPPASSSPSSSGGSSGDEPPRLTKPASPAEAPSAPAGSSSGGSASGPNPASAPTSNGKSPKTVGATPSDGPKAPESDSGAGEANRPRLRRGKPAESFADEEVPGYSKPGGVAPASSASAAKAATPAADGGPIQLLPAISDASGPAPRSFTFEWLKDEEGERRQQMLALAKEQLVAYLNAQAKAQVVPKAAGVKAARSAAPRKAPDPIIENVRMVAYDLWTNNQPVMVFSAVAHMPPPPAGRPQSADSQLEYSITLAARTDIYNNLVKLYVGITDKYHLDLTPRLELIDAVDADGDGRGELLFRETSDAGTGWLIYRATADKLWKMYDSLNPE